MQAVIIGGGAAGLTAALTAARNGHSVTILEAQNRVGRKLAVTGNGRCNLTNLEAAVSRYHGEDPAFVGPALQALDAAGTLAFFRNLGLLTTAEPGGRVYPLSDQATGVVDVLRFACDAAGVQTRTACRVTEIRPAAGGFSVRTEAGNFSADRVIVCAGGAAGARYGGSAAVYSLLTALGHSRTKLFPSLVQIKTGTALVRSLKGVRADAAVTVLDGAGRPAAQSAGEVQFTDYGLSGPAVFEVSRAAAAGQGSRIALDLLRNYTLQDIAALLRARRSACPALTYENLLTGMLHNRLGRTLLRACGLDLHTPLSSLTEAEIRRIAQTAKCWELQITGTMGFDAAQVTAGGIRTAEFRPDTLGSRLVPGLYAAGEILDIDGDCGGFNLQWAWASGRLAGRLG